MNSLRNLLQDADPLRREAPRLDVERDRIRAALRATAVGVPARPVRVSRPIAVTIAAAAVGVAAFVSVVWLHAPTQVLAAVRFEVRLAEERPMPGLIVAQVGESGRLLYLHPEIVVGNDDIAQSRVLDDGSGRFGVAVEFLPSGAERMRRATASHVGRPLAILVDGRVVLAPVVRSPIGESAVISGDYTRAEAQRIADGIAGP